MQRVLLLTILASTTFFAATVPEPQPRRQQLVFEPNRGQAASDVRWIARGPGYEVLFTTEGFTIGTVRMRFPGGHPLNNMSGAQPTGGVSHYFRGNDPAKWHAGVPHYRRPHASGLCKGVDLV